jgi:hypothetical protein
MTADILIVTYKKDFPYLKWCLRSIAKFAKGFHSTKLLVPTEDVAGALDIIREIPEPREVPFVVGSYAEKEGKGMLWHMRQIMYADKWCDADIIGHIDADCIFDSPITPDNWLKNGKIILRYEPFKSICKRHDAMSRWQECTQKILPFPVMHETMRGHPEVYHRSTYPLAREIIERKVNIRIDEYILSCENAFPQTFCEHVTLGNVAMERQPELYEAIRQESDCPTPDNQVFQAWSHGAIDQPQDLWYKGKQASFVPLQMFETILTSTRYIPTPEDEERMKQ